MRSQTTAHQADLSFGIFRRRNELTKPQLKLRIFEERGNVDRFRILTENRRVRDASQGVPHIDVSEPGRRNNQFQPYSPEVFPIAGLRHASNIHQVSHAVGLQEIDKGLEATIAIASGKDCHPLRFRRLNGVKWRRFRSEVDLKMKLFNPA